MMNNVHNTIMNLHKTYQYDLFPAVNKSIIDELQKNIGPIPKDLIEFYNITNGLQYGWFEILPIADPMRMKKTWDDIKRANDIQTTKFLRTNPELLDRYIVFADIGQLRCAMFSKQDETIWYEENEEIIQTDLNLEEFIKIMITEVNDL